MGLFKDFKEDFSQAVGEMLPGIDDEEEGEGSVDLVVDTLGEDVDVRSELSKLDGLLEDVDAKQDLAKPEPAPAPSASFVHDLPPIKQSIPKEESAPTMTFSAFEAATPKVAPAPAPTSLAFTSETNKTIAPNEEKRTMSDTLVMESKAPEVNAAVGIGEVVDETTVITESTSLTGDLTSAGSFEIQGTINGNVACNGKLSVTGTINGNSSASEFFADVAKIEGEVVSSGTVKIGAGSVIVGNITAASAVIAGAVKGDIDVQGPVVVDTSAVIMGNIKSRSVQINNGAVIEGFCSQCYADIDVQGLFDGK